MSKAKSPQEKKRLSLERDRRNCYGENSKASRKAIPRRKKAERKKERLDARRALEAVREDEDEEIKLRTERPRRWKKVPDQPLKDHIKTSKRLRSERTSRKDRRTWGPRKGEITGWIDEVDEKSAYVTIDLEPREIAEILLDKFRPEDRPELKPGTIFYISKYGIRLCQAKWTQKMIDDAMRRAEKYKDFWLGKGKK